MLCTVAVFALASVVGVACGDQDEGAGSVTTGGGAPGTSAATVTPGPEPVAMCADGQLPILAAYAIDTGSHLWSTCGDGTGLHTIRGVTDELVLLQTWSDAEQQMMYLAFDARTGEPLWTGDEARGADALQAAVAAPFDGSVAVDGVRLSGGQDDPMVAIDEATGQTLWTRDGHPVYDNVWAVGDGAVFAVESRDSGSVLVGYELAGGDIRWEDPLEPGAGFMSPWFVSDQRLLVLWFNLQVRSTVDGTVVWQTDYAVPAEEFPRMIGAVADATTVYVTFTGEAAGGD